MKRRNNRIGSESVSVTVVPGPIGLYRRSVLEEIQRGVVRILPAGGASRTRPRLDTVGMLLLSPGLAALVYGLSEIGIEGGFGNTKVIAGLVIGVVLLAGVNDSPARVQPKKAALTGPSSGSGAESEMGRSCRPASSR